MKLKKYFFTSIFILLPVLVGCLPEKDSPSCPDGQSYDAFLRRCVDDGLEDEDPNGNRLPFPGPGIVVATGEDTPIAISVPTGSDQDGDSLSYYISSNPLFGSVNGCMDTSGSTGADDVTCTFTNSANLNGGDYFTYYVYDGSDRSPSVAYVYVTVTAINDAPTFANATPTGAMNESGPATPTYLNFTFQGDEGGLSDEDTQGLSLSISSSNSSVIAPARVTVSYKGTPIGSSTGSSDFLALADGTSDASANDIKLSIYPVQYAGSDTEINLLATLKDGTLTTTQNFKVKVKHVDNPPYFQLVPTPMVAIEGTPISIGPWVVDEGGGDMVTDGDDEDVSQDLTVMVKVTASPGAYGIGDFTIAATPYATAVIDNSDAAENHPFAITVRPTSNPDANGKITLNVAISDGVTTEYKNLDIHVTPVNDPPLICDITFADAPSTCTPVPSPAAVDEGTPVPTVAVMVDEGGNGFEDGQEMTFELQSLNTFTIPNESLFWSYGAVSAAGGTPMALGDGSSDSSDVAIMVVVTPGPEINTSLSGPVGIKMIATDSEGTPSASTFYVTINAQNDDPVITADAEYTAGIEANEGGKIYDLGFTLDEGGAYDEDQQGLTITLSSSNTTLIPNVNLSANYYAIATPGTFTGNLTPVNWGDNTNNASASGKKLNLNIQPVAGLSGSADITLSVQDSLGASTSYVIPILVDDVSALNKGWSEIKSLASAHDSEGNVLATPYVSLSWNAMTMVGSSISHYNVYRSIGPDIDDFNFASPIATTADENTLSFTDTSVEDQTMYWYLVAPVDTTSTPTYALPIEPEDRIVRVVVPPTNMILVHRWMANKEMCNQMGLTADRYNNYRCAYVGPADTSAGYYDRTADLVIDRFEAGCNYAKADSGMCSENEDGVGCIGEGDPEAAENGFSAVDGSLYYDRTNGQCYMSVSGSWYTLQEVASNSADPAGLTQGGINWYDTEFHSGHLPPLGRVSQAQASNFCDVGRDSFTLANDPDGNSFNYRLPLREEQIVAAAWPTSIYSNISSYESGANLDSSGYCNTNSGNGLTYEDGAVPSTHIDTLPGSLSSGIFLVRTGSEATKKCTSRFGAQDLIGNVSEWSVERIWCDDGSSVNFEEDADAGANEAVDTCLSDSRIDNAFYGTFSISGGDRYHFNGVDDFVGTPLTGICGGGDDGTDDDAGTDCDSDLLYSASAYTGLSGGTYFNFAGGLPVTASYTTTKITNVATTASTELYEDTFTLDARSIFAGNSSRGGLLFGGDFNDVNGAGRFNFNVGITSDGAYHADIFPSWDTGFRCGAAIGY